MTCIIGYIDKDKVWMGSDSAASSDTEIYQRKDSKMFFKNDFLIGCAGGYRAIQIVQHIFNPTRIKKGQDVMNYMVSVFAKELAQCFKENGIINEADQCDLLVAFKGRLFAIYDDFQIEEKLEDWNTIGDSDKLVLGALKALEKSNIKPNAKILKVLKIAEHYNASVKHPFKVLSI